MLYFHVFISDVKNALFTDVVMEKLDIEPSSTNGQRRGDGLL